MSGRKHLLVEGKYDQQFFRIFLNTFMSHTKVDIDTAENLSDPEIIVGNRQKVEKVAKIIQLKEYASKFVAFVDREYREFDLEVVADKLECHNQIFRLVWSRGHSIENYFFDYQIIYESLLGLSSVECFDKAIKDFADCFEKTIRIACALGLTGNEVQKTEMIRKSIHSDLFKIQNSEIVLQVEQWENSLKKRKFTEEEVLKAVNSFQRWLQKLTDVSFETVQWLCDGHSGIEIIWAVYHRCVFNNTSENARNEADKIYKVPEDARFQTLTSWLFRRAKTKESIYPYEVLNLLGVDLC
ncbi:MAG: hypothetical protein ACKPCM_20640 [Pseudanabaena sp.]